MLSSGWAKYLYRVLQTLIFSLHSSPVCLRSSHSATMTLLSKENYLFVYYCQCPRPLVILRSQEVYSSDARLPFDRRRRASEPGTHRSSLSQGSSHHSSKPDSEEVTDDAVFTKTSTALAESQPDTSYPRVIKVGARTACIVLASSASGDIRCIYHVYEIAGRGIRGAAPCH